MIELRGKYNEAIVFTENIEGEAVNQIIELCNQEFASESKIRMMPDVHAGAGCTIGTTMTIKDKVVPNLVGVDIGCGMLCVKLKEKEIDFQMLDDVIRKFVPSGANIRETVHKFSDKVKIENLRCKSFVNLNKAYKSIGTLGGGNHFLEVNKDSEGNLYLVVHTGSRNLGMQVATFYQNLAYKTLMDNRDEKLKLINEYKALGKEEEIQKALKNIKKPKVSKEMAYLEGKNLEDYLHDINIVQMFSNENRKAIAETILNKTGLTEVESFTTIHNYIDLDNSILRKGAISAQKGEIVLIPINMRDGSIIAIGKGNENWNYSAPHGAGRLMSRSKAKEKVSLDEFVETMKDVWSTSVCESTLDESPMAYKPIEDILSNISDTVDVIDIIKPLYNYKAN